mgnify:CR=1 FL=1
MEGTQTGGLSHKKLGFDPGYLAEFENKVFIEGAQSSRKLVNFFVLLLLATVIATYGLLSQSTATVIGAMIVAPLMLPIMGLAFSLSIADRDAILSTLLVSFAGIVLAVAVGFVLTLPIARVTNPAAIQQITEILRERHRIRTGEPDDFTIRDMTEMTNTLTSTTRLMTNLLLCVAMISLVVGGVGIMNIMLVSVTERTREIGLRMAVGARARDILRQFLVEAVVLCLVGGAAGILLGHGGSRLVELLLRWPVATSLPAIAAAVLVSAGVGIVFGFYPAWKASRLDPIDALRYE